MNALGDVFIHAEAIVDKTATIGPNVTVEKGAKIEGGARVRNSIILAGAEIKVSPRICSNDRCDDKVLVFTILTI